MLSFLRRQKSEPEEAIVQSVAFLEVDMHSHLIPGVDDGAKTPEESLALVRTLAAQGYRKLIATPHVMSDFYFNDPRQIASGFSRLQQAVEDAGIEIELSFAAEYYLDTVFLNEVLPNGLLTFGDRYALVEVGMAGWPYNFDDCIFSVLSKGYQAVLAHPERYQYEQDLEKYRKLKQHGVLLQLNMLSATGYYGPAVKNMALQLLDAGLYDFLGTDMHHERHAALVAGLAAQQQPLMQKLAAYPHWRNKTL